MKGGEDGANQGHVADGENVVPGGEANPNNQLNN